MTWEPRSNEELESLEALVSSAVGFDADRGDVITIRSLEFQPVLAEGTESTAADASLLSGLDLMSAIQLAVLAVVAIVLGLFVVRPVLTSSSGMAEAPPGLALPPVPPLESSADGDAPGFEAIEPLGDTAFPALPEPAIADFGPPDLPGLAPMPAGSSDPAERLRAMIEERQSETLEVLQSWVEEEPQAS